MSSPIPPEFAHAVEKLNQLREYEDAEKIPERMAKAASRYFNLADFSRDLEREFGARNPTEL